MTETNTRWDHHAECACGCGELSDECAGPMPTLLGSILQSGSFRRSIPGVRGQEDEVHRA